MSISGKSTAEDAEVLEERGSQEGQAVGGHRAPAYLPWALFPHPSSG